MNNFLNGRRLWVALVLLVWFCFPVSGCCCEPVFPLFQLLTGSSIAGPAVLTQSLLWLFVAIAIKCGAFVVLERRLPWGRAVLFMVLANIISAIPGILIAAFTSSGTGFGIIVALPMVFALGWIVQRRIALLLQPARPLRMSGGAAVLFFVGFFIASMVLFVTAESVLHTRNYASYWILKFCFVTLVACTGIVISAVLEESVIARLSRKSLGNQSFYSSVFRANYITLSMILLVAAVKILPQRLRSPDFIASWLHSMLAALFM